MILNPPPSPAEPLTISSQHAAEVCGVHASTVKRWCDSGELTCSHTAGGHRRIPLVALAQFAQGQGIDTPWSAFGDQTEAVWLAAGRAVERGDFQPLVDLWFGWLMGDQAERLLPSLGWLLDRGLDLPLVLDEGICGLMRQVGDAWRRGRIGVGDEHRVSEQIIDLLHALRLRPLAGEAAAGREQGPPRRAVVAAATGNRHQLAAFMVRSVLEARGWRVDFLGADIPAEEIAAQQRLWGAGLICVSFSAPLTTADAERLARALALTYDRARPYHLILGGNALMERAPLLPAEPFRSALILPDLRSLAAWLDTGGDDAHA